MIFIPALCLPLRAETALEQFNSLGLETGSVAPQPSVEKVWEPISPEAALNKLALFNYQKTDVISVKRSVPVVHKQYSIEKIQLLINDPLRQLGEFTQTYMLYRTMQPGPRPTVLVFPPFIPQVIDDWSATRFAKKGYNAVIVVPCESLTDKTRPLDKVDDLLIRNVITGRMCIDLLETLPEVDKDKIYAYGISMGGIRTTLSFGVEPRIKKAAEIVGGGDIPGIIADTRFDLLEGLRDARMEIEGIANVADFRAYMEKVMTIDPLDFAVLRQPEDIFLVLGHGDRFVPDAYQKKLYEVFSRPEEGRYPAVIRASTGHIVTALKFKRYIDRFIEFFER